MAGFGRNGRVVGLGEIVVEIIAETSGDGFFEPLPLRGPFPSGAPAIFIDQVGRLGQEAALISAVGDDDFGHLVIDRLRADGVGTDAIRVVPDRVTGTAFVRYREDGERRFVFNIRDSASGLIKLDAASRAMLEASAHLHVVGSSLFSGGLIEAAREAVRIVRGTGGTVSFDPNVRREMLAPAMRQALSEMLRACDLFLPSGDELSLLTGGSDEDAAIAEVLSLGVREVVVKRGAAGASYHDRDGSLTVPALPARERDPTGAGDCFGATFVTCRLSGVDPARSLRYVAASGAAAVAAVGPMEGASDFEVLDRMIANAN